MDSRLYVTREDLYDMQMEIKQVQYTQANHADRIARIEKRQADDAALKSVWNSPFPGVLSSTPQNGPVPQEELFDDLDEQAEQLLGSLHLGPAEEEPTRRGAASRANSVRFDESALHGSSWAGHSNRHSGDFAPIRPGSGFMMERSLSHKSDGRHSSAVSVHSHHSVASGRASSLGLDTNFATGDDDDSSLDIPAPPVSFYVLGSVPSIIRCWLTTNYAHGTLLYADICTGSQRSTVHHSLLEELDLLNGVERDSDGVYRTRLHVYLSEAMVVQHSNRSPSPGRAVPSMSVLFDVVRTDGKGEVGIDRSSIRIFIGSDALRAHSADVLFSRNIMVLYSDDRSRLRIPFVRPEDDGMFRNIATGSVVPEKPKLNVNAAPFVFGESLMNNAEEDGLSRQPSPPNSSKVQSAEPCSEPSYEPSSPVFRESECARKATPAIVSESGGESDRIARQKKQGTEMQAKDGPLTNDVTKKQSPSGIWASWRLGGSSTTDGSSRESGLLSGYQPAARGSRGMKILKSHKSSPSSARGETWAAPSKPGGDGRRRSLVGMMADSTANGGSGSRCDAKQRAVSAGAGSGSDSKTTAQHSGPDTTSAKRANPVGGASAFSWMTPPTKGKASAVSNQ